MALTIHQSLTVTNTSSAANFIFLLPKKFQRRFIYHRVDIRQNSKYSKTDRLPTAFCAFLQYFISVMDGGYFP